MTPDVSVVIPTHNRAHLLQECLESLNALRYPITSFEVIVVDDGSTDTTAETVAHIQKQVMYRLHYIRQENRGPAAARNQGVQAASSDLVAFTDDDCTVHPEWLKELVVCFDADRVGGVGGAIHSRSGNLIARYHECNNTLASDLSGKMVPPYLITGNACYRRVGILEAGGFDEAISHPGGEDPDLSWRVTALGYSLKFNPAAIVYHHHETRLADFIRSFYHYGRGYRYIATKHGLHQGGGLWWEDISKALSPRYFAYRTKQYAMARGLGWRTAIVFAFLDHVREVAWLRGYWSLNS